MNSFSPRDDITSKPSAPVMVYNPVASNEIIDVGRFLGMLLDHKWWIALVVIIFTLGGVAYVSLQTPIYSSNALVQVERRGSVNPIGDAEMTGGILESGGVAAEVEILRSRMVLGKVIDKLGLDTHIVPRKLPVVGDYVLSHNISRPDFRGLPVIGGWIERHDLGVLDSIEHHPAIWGGETIQVARLDVSDRFRGFPLTLKVVGDDSYRIYMNDEPVGEGSQGSEASFLDGEVLIRVQELEAPVGAEFILLKSSRLDAINSLSSRLSIYEVGEAGRTGRTSTGILRVTLTGADRNEIRQTLDAIVDTFLLQNVERKTVATQQSLAFLEKQAPELRAQLENAENRLSEYRASVDSIDLDAEGLSVIEQFIEIERQINELSMQEVEVTQRFTRNHPTYRSLSRQIAYLTAERERLNERVNAMPTAQKEVIRRTRDVEVTQVVYVNVLNKLQELELAKAGTIGTLRIIDTAAVGRVPIYPQKASMVGVAFVLGLLLAIIIVVVRGLFNRGVESPEQLENMGYPVYATVPLSNDQLRLKPRFMERQRRRGEHGILANTHPEDAAVEALRGLRTALHFAMMDAPNNCLMVCGPSPDIGKSFITLNLGAVCVQGGQRVLVIDSDLRKGNLHRTFGHASSAGLSEVLSGRQDFTDVIRSSGIDGLEYLSRGMSPPNPSELLMCSRFSQMIDRACQEYDLVIMDTPPVLAVTDAAVIGKQAGTALMVARFQVNPPKEIKLAYNRLQNVGVEVRGCIINGMQRKATTAYGYGYYHYTYSPNHRNKVDAEEVKA
ncbi:polysaccharide biosynthesis tyrosine autokinase [Halomonas kalidii]|uniref:Polysaccharide biosynthesis tyrosine autokinase n=1 Tax=Halomonas kalidii TaxID=3043293 RepID=A0ABT6VLI6_9GAMM|nr:polysaccharide biosynthesis tyrosine autokinase [Halomonas kalidii]MDI5934142.1 polysaccharide biosynthesis tyrosine autokinase [Halomonas kalidii]